VNTKDFSNIEVPTTNTYIIDLVSLQNRLNNKNAQKLFFSENCTFKLNDTLLITNSNITIEIPNSTKIIATFSDKNVIKITGSNCKIIGNGVVESPAVWLPRDSGYFWDYAVIFIEGDNCSIRDITLNNVPRVGIGIHEKSNIDIINTKIKGNMPTDSAQTGHFGIAFDPGTAYPSGNIKIQDCFVSGTKEGILLGNWGAGIGYGVNICNNTFQECYDHAVYGSNGVNNVNVLNNIMIDCRAPIAVTGRNVNNMYSLGSTLVTTFGTAISVRDGISNIISNNNIKYNADALTDVIILQNLNGSELSNNIISNNCIDTGINAVIAIRVSNGATTPKTQNNVVQGNIIKCKARGSYGLISVTNGAGAYALKNKIIDNVITIIDSETQGYGIYTLYQKYADNKGNIIDILFNATTSTTVRCMMINQTFISNIKNNILTCLSGSGTNITAIGINEGLSSDKNIIESNGIQFTSTSLTSAIPTSFLSKTAMRNRISEDDMCGTSIITNGSAVIQVNNKNVNTNSRISVTNANSESGKKGHYLELFNGYFNIRTSDGTVTSSDAKYFWEIA